MKKTMPLPADIQRAVEMLNEAGYEAYIVGGSVRSWLLGDEIHDYDLTTSATPQEMKMVFQDHKTIDTGIKHGTVTVLFGKTPVEITTYRTESDYTDHRHPDTVRFTRSLREDLSRRDFTINAMCYHPREGIIDYLNGIQDLNNSLIRTVGSPQERFTEDALRICRAVRFAAQLEFKVEEKTAEAVLAMLPSIRYVSQERITSELSRTLGAPGLPAVLKEFRPVFLEIIPELRDYSPAQWQSIDEMIQNTPPHFAVRMALLLDGVSDIRTADALLRRLKYSNADRNQVLCLLLCRDLPLDSRTDLRIVLSRISVPFPVYLEYRVVRDGSLNREALNELYGRIIADNDCVSLKQLSVNGEDLKEAGLRGREISAALQMLLHAVMEETCENEKDALLRYLSHHPVSHSA